MHIRQGEAKGLGHAILCAHPLVGDNPFAVLLPDVLIDEVASDPLKDNLAEMVKLFVETSVSQIMVEPVPQEKVSEYGIANINGERLAAGESLPMTEIVEKPAVKDAPSNLAVVGRYVLSANIWPLLEKTPLGAGDEIQLTDAIAMLMEKEQVNAYFMKGKSHDCGSKLGYMKANIEYGLRHKSIGADFQAYLKEVVARLD